MISMNHVPITLHFNIIPYNCSYLIFDKDTQTIHIQHMVQGNLHVSKQKKLEP